MILLAVGLFLAERDGPPPAGHHQISLGTALAVGFAQALAVSAGRVALGQHDHRRLVRHLKREAAARFSFLLGTPIIIGSGIKKGYDVIKVGGIPADQQAGFAIGFHRR